MFEHSQYIKARECCKLTCHSHTSKRNVADKECGKARVSYSQENVRTNTIHESNYGTPGVIPTFIKLA